MTTGKRDTSDGFVPMPGEHPICTLRPCCQRLCEIRHAGPLT